MIWAPFGDSEVTQCTNLTVDEPKHVWTVSVSGKLVETAREKNPAPLAASDAGQNAAAEAAG